MFSKTKPSFKDVPLNDNDTLSENIIIILQVMTIYTSVLTQYM